MKIRYLIGKILLFSAIFSLFLLFPLFQKSAREPMDFSTIPVFFMSLSECLSGAVVLFLCKRLYSIPIYIQYEKCAASPINCKKKSQNKKIRAFLFLKDAGDVFLCFGILCVFSAVLQVIAFLQQNEKMTMVIFPTGFKWIICICTLFFSAFYEEALYRIFVPEYLLSIFTSDLKSNSAKMKKISCILCELFTLLLFALSHRYLGILSVINAAFAHIALRFFLKKDKNLFITVFAHFLYNLISLLLIWARQ